MNPPDLPGLPRDAAGAPVFAEVWHARAFALAVLLNEGGAFKWRDFAAALALDIKRNPGADYYAAWLRALEAVLSASGIADEGTVARVADAWRRAAAATPHGQPIRLESTAP